MLSAEGVVPVMAAKVIIREITEPDPPDFDRLTELAKSDDVTVDLLEGMARLFGQTDPERF